MNEKDKWILEQTILNGKQENHCEKESESRLNVNEIKSEPNSKTLKRVLDGTINDIIEVKKVKLNTSENMSNKSSDVTIK